MRVLTLCTAKGGTGKSTLAASLGVAATEAGEKVFLIDLDPQGSLMAWGKRRQADEPGIDRTEVSKLGGALDALRRAGYTLAILDTAGTDTASAAGMRAADLALIPARPSTLDIEASKPTISALITLDRDWCFVMNSCPAGKLARVEDAARALVMLGGLAKPLIVQRTDHVDAIGLGLGVTEHNPEGKAAEEIRQLWAWINRRMADGTAPRTQ